MTTLITPEIEAWVGRRIDFKGDVVTLGEIRRFAAASDDHNPDYGVTGTGGETLAPPMLYYGITRPFAASSEFAEDGTVWEHRPMVGAGQSMGGSVETEWLLDLQEGDLLRGVRTLASLQEKAGSRMHFVLATWVTEYFNQDDNLVVRERYEQILF